MSYKNGGRTGKRAPICRQATSPRTSLAADSAGWASPGHTSERPPRPPRQRPLLGRSPLVRLVWLLVATAAWVAVLLKGSAELFPETYDELMLGGSSNDVDIGLSGDYLGWGERRNAPGELHDFGELADVIGSLWSIYNSALLAWNDSVVDVSSLTWQFLLGDDFDASGYASGGFVDDFDPSFFLGLSRWLVEDGGNTRPSAILLAKAREKKAADAAAADAEQRRQAYLNASGGPQGFLRWRQAARLVAHAASDAGRAGNVFLVRMGLPGVGGGDAGRARRRTELDAKRSARQRAALERLAAKQARLKAKAARRAEQLQAAAAQKGIVPAVGDGARSGGGGEDGRPRFLERRWVRPLVWRLQRRHEGGGGSHLLEPSVAGSAEETAGLASGAAALPGGGAVPGGPGLVPESGNRDEAMTPKAQQAAIQAEVLGELRLRLAERYPNLTAVAAATGMDVGDKGLGRYLAVTRWQVETKTRDAAAMVGDTASWRLEHHRFTPRGSLASPRDRAVLLEAARTMQIWVNGFDREGRGVVIYTPTSEGACSLNASLAILVHSLEKALALGAAGASPTGQTVDQYTFIVDLSQMGLSPPMKVVRASFEIMGRHYPMRPGRIFLVNGGGMIAWIWRVLEPLVDPRTREKVSIVGAGDEARVLAEAIDPSQLEARFKGGRNAFAFDPEAYLEQDVLEALPIPPPQPQPQPQAQQQAHQQHPDLPPGSGQKQPPQLQAQQQQAQKQQAQQQPVSESGKAEKTSWGRVGRWRGGGLFGVEAARVGEGGVAGGVPRASAGMEAEHPAPRSTGDCRLSV